MVLAQDEASLYLQASTMRVWSPIGQTPVIPVSPTREHVHFYGCLNVFTGEEIAMQASEMNSEVTALFLEKVNASYPERPILILWDRAPWHGGDSVRGFFARNPRIEEMKFPPASPDLNPQEHVWKQTREKISHNHDIVKMSQLADAFETHLTKTVFKCSMLDKFALDSICPSLN